MGRLQAFFISSRTRNKNIKNNNRFRRFAECPAGAFIYNGSVFFKSEYGDEAFCASSGEMFWGGASNVQERNNLIVRPIKYETLYKALRKYTA